MSSKENNKPLDRAKVKSFVQQHYGTYNDFCKARKINYRSFCSFMLGLETMPAIDKAVRETMHEHDYPVEWAEDPTIETNIQQAFNKAKQGKTAVADLTPELRLQIESTP